jgi:hypothetical protein
LITPCTKQSYPSLAAAEDALARIVREYRRTRHGGKSWKRLVAYRCAKCLQWHHGRDNTEYIQKMHDIANNPPVKKIPTTGELKRRLRRIEEKLDGEKLNRLYSFGKIMAAQQQAEADAEARRTEVTERVRDLQDSVRIASQL